MAPSTALRLLRTLTESRFALHDAETRTYRPGMRLLQLGVLVQGRFNFTQIARPVLERLFDRVQETVNLGILSDDLSDVIHIDKIVTDRVVRIDTALGRTAPSHCTALGKAMLAFRPSLEVVELLERTNLVAYTRNTIVDAHRVMDELAQVRARGYAEDREEYSEYLECVAAPVFDATGEAFAGISTSRISIAGDSDLSHLAAEVVQAARELSAAPSLLRFHGE